MSTKVEKPISITKNVVCWTIAGLILWGTYSITSSVPKSESSGTQTTSHNDFTQARQVARAAVEGGLATKGEHDSSVLKGYQHINLWIGSLLPGDARQVAAGVCDWAKANYKWEYPWTVRVHLVVGQAPAATCQIAKSWNKWDSK